MQDSAFFLPILGYMVIYFFTSFAFRDYPKLTSEEIEKINPEIGGIKYKYYIMLVVIVGLSMPIGFLMISNMTGPSPLFFLPIMLTYTFFEAGFALVTGVFPLKSRHNLDRFVYTVEEDISWVAYAQILIAMVVATITVFLSVL